MKKLVLILCSLILPLFVSQDALACMCARDPAVPTRLAVAKELKRSELVFVGVPAETNALGLRFSVVKAWKGKATNPLTFHSSIYRTRSDNNDREIFINSCALLFETGKKYLVYADVEDRELFVSKCSRTRLLETASEDIVELDKLATKAKSFCTRRICSVDLLNPELQLLMSAGQGVSAKELENLIVKTHEPLFVDGDRVYRATEVTQRAVVEFKPEPSFTEQARKKKTHGSVEFLVVVLSSGEVKIVSVRKQLPNGLTEEAEKAANRIRFRPAVLAGKAVPQIMLLQYNFNRCC